MAYRVQAFAAFGPRIKYADPMGAEEFIEQLVVSTNQSRGSLIAVLAEIESISESALKSGRAVKLPNGMILRPVMKRDGHIAIVVRVNPDLTRRINGDFRGKIINAKNIGKSEQEIIEIWDENNPDNVIES